VINADSMQVYADLRILTARPDRRGRDRARTGCSAMSTAPTAYSAARWAIEARAAIAEAHAAGRLPILVGGTGMYLRTLLEGIAPYPRSIQRCARGPRAPVADTHAELAIADPDAAAKS
jgi:tRNA dimethylallyltransferase